MFTKGQRVKYTSSYYPRGVPNAKQMASMGRERVMLLNAKDEHGRNKPITGTIMADGEILADGSVWYDFIPDGWECASENGFPAGFGCPEKELTALDDETLVLPGTITDRMGRPIGGDDAKS